MEDLWRLREKIEKLDLQIAKLLDKRMALVEKLAYLKKENGLPLRDHQREEELLKKVLTTPFSHLTQSEVLAFWNTIFSLSFLRQQEHLGLNTEVKICVTVFERDPEEARRLIEGVKGKVHFVELRLDALRELPQSLPEGIRYIFTCRRKEEGGLFEGKEEERVSLLKEALQRFNGKYVDIEWKTPGTLKRDFLNREDLKVILSYHVFSGTPPLESLWELFEEMKKDRAEVYKIVTTAHSLEDSFRVLLFLRELTKRGFKVVGHAMGSRGKLSRLLSPFVGGAFVYVSLGPGKEAASGQMSLEEFKQGLLLLRRYLE
jgi:3-dehydroquinate dehydratase type I